MANEVSEVSTARVSGRDFGLGDDVAVENLKEEAVHVARSKKPRLTHEIFFQDNGLKKVIQDFPKLKFQGKGHEFEDLKVMMAAYKKWLKDLYPFQDDFEELIWKARDVLQKKEQTEIGESDPRQHLHMLRFHYKKGEERDAEEKARASDLDSETAKRVAENRAKALERKRQRDAKAQFPEVDDEDAFGFGAPDMFEDVFDFGEME
eukprot:symbB.v1.2.013500.t1/scaffold959.1/size148843/9